MSKLSRPNIPFVLAILAVVMFLVAAIASAHGASGETTPTVQVVYLAPDDAKDVQAARATLDAAQVGYDAVVAKVAAQYAQEDVKPPSVLITKTGDAIWSFVNSGYWQNSGPRPPSPAEGKRWLNGFYWGFQFLADYSGIIPTPAPPSSEEKSATIQLFKR